ncbi:ap-4 complex subunit mu-1 [Anaeramoeba flamelloides]|uniref:Ap-4 complex subunit mu-1 n=1 Tax=Anaeramoeba flamelloides TaxID=1746091 RepID=A0AAV7YW60_9EUKA|nr:ap-4 complex subunit mu-1 [Anaeramoeba flamelloides]
MISQFFILSSSGDRVIHKNFSNEISEKTKTWQVLFNKLKDCTLDCPPIFYEDGVNYIVVNAKKLTFCFTTVSNLSPFYLLELLRSIITLIKDFCGVINEQSIKQNFAMIHEIIDEAIDFGFPQNTQSQTIKKFVCNEPIILQKIPSSQKLFSTKEKKTVSFQATNKSIKNKRKLLQKKKNEEIYIDLIEKIVLQFNDTGEVIRSELNGKIQIKSFLKTPSHLKIGFNKLIIGPQDEKFNYMEGIIIEDCNLHRNCDVSRLDRENIIKIIPPEGEFILMNYRMSGQSVKIPFRIFPIIENISNTMITMKLKIHSDYAEHIYGSSVLVYFKVPDEVISLSYTIDQQKKNEQGSQQVKFDKNQRKVFWKIQKFFGECEKHLFCNLILKSGIENIKKLKSQIGPICMEFEIPSHSSSDIKIKSIKTIPLNNLNKKIKNPIRYKRNITFSKSYFMRL